MHLHALSSFRGTFLAVVLALFASVAVGCGGGSSGKLMVDSPLTPFEAPDEEDLAGEDDDEDEAEAAPAAAGEKE